tara:strand:+ start:122 stop:913 length:792 start_codon:yes stop_codon:yes gene_type:complete
MAYIGKIPAAAALTSSDIADGIIITDKLANDAVVTSKITDGTIAQADISNQAINEAKMQISNAPTNGYMLTAQSGNTGGLTWAEAGGGGTALVHTSNITSDTSNIVIDGIFSSTYKNYLIVGKARNASSDVQLELRYRQGGSTITTTNYRRTWNGNYGTTSSSVSDYGSATYGDDAITIINNMNSNTYSGAYFTIWLFDPLGTANYKNVMFQSISESVNSPKSFMNLTGNGLFYANTTALTGLDFYCTSVDIAEANIKIYGLL